MVHCGSTEDITIMAGVVNLRHATNQIERQSVLQVVEDRLYSGVSWSPGVFEEAAVATSRALTSEASGGLPRLGLKEDALLVTTSRPRPRSAVCLRTHLFIWGVLLTTIQITRSAWRVAKHNNFSLSAACKVDRHLVSSLESL